MKDFEIVLQIRDFFRKYLRFIVIRYSATQICDSVTLDSWKLCELHLLEVRSWEGLRTFCPEICWAYRNVII